MLGLFERPKWPEAIQRKGLLTDFNLVGFGVEPIFFFRHGLSLVNRNQK
jgi:hypothetical protein